MPNQHPIIGIVTDFGEKGTHYIASMKGVILSLSEDVTLIDISHDITPFSLLETSYLIFTMYHYYPSGSVFLIVVDPGVGSQRKIVALQTHSSHYFVGPDNGIFTHLLSSDKIEKVVSVENNAFFRENISQTFHGRDVMAPVAAHLAMGTELEKFGPELSPHELKTLSIRPQFYESKGKIEGIIQYIDSFGTATTNIAIDDYQQIKNTSIRLKPNSKITLIFDGMEYRAEFCTHFSEVEEGNYLFLKGSYGYLEIAKNQGNASKKIGLNLGDQITLEFS